MKSLRRIESFLGVSAVLLLSLGCSENGARNNGMEDEGVCSIDHWCWQNPYPQGNDLNSVWGVDIGESGGISDIHIWAVGDAGTIIHWDGKKWSGVDWSHLGFEFPYELRDVWATNNEAVWAVGRYNIVNWDGKDWSSSLSEEGFDLHGVYGFSTEDVWAIGDNATILHWDGKSWSSKQSPLQSDSDCRKIWGSSSDDVWIIAYKETPGTEFIHWNGTEWSEAQTDLEPGCGVVHVDGTSRDNVWIVANCGDVTSSILRWDGTNWITIADRDFSLLRDLCVVSKNHAWVNDIEETIYNWDGNTWWPMWDGEDINLSGIWCSPEVNLWAVGDEGVIIHFNGAEFSLVTVGLYLSNYTDNLIDVWAIASDDAWAVGGGGPSMTLHWDGISWTDVPNPTFEERLYAVWGAASDDVWAVGYLGTIIHWDGFSWSNESISINETLHCIWGSSSDDIWVGATGAIFLHWDGNEWNLIDKPGHVITQQIFGFGPNDVWAVGDEAVYHFNGETWSSRSEGITSGVDLHGLWGARTDDLWITGEAMDTPRGRFFHWDGSIWSEVGYSGDHQDGVLDIFGIGSDRIWAISGHSIFHWDGSTWSQEKAGRFLESFTGIGGSDDSVWVVGPNSSILSKKLHP